MTLNEKFHFREWPFAIVPSEERGHELWADRFRTAEQIANTLQSWSVSPSSTINLLWADLGAGKTHTLLHIEAECKKLEMLPIYVLLPQSITRFNALYHAIAGAIQWDEVASQLPDRAAGRFTVSLRRALQWITPGVDSRRQGMAERWLLGDRLTQSQCDAIGVSSPISTGDDCVEVLRLAIGALNQSTNRVVLMIDEYQRVAEGTRRQLQEIGHGIHTLYNACPRGFTLLLSCAMGNAEDHATVLTPEILSRLSAQRIDLPYLSTKDIKAYVSDLFVHYRALDSAADRFFPLSEDVVNRIADLLRDELSDEVTPRKLNEVLDDFLLWVGRSVATLPVTDSALSRWFDDSGREALRRLRG